MGFLIYWGRCRDQGIGLGEDGAGHQGLCHWVRGGGGMKCEERPVGFLKREKSHLPNGVGLGDQRGVSLLSQPEGLGASETRKPKRSSFGIWPQGQVHLICSIFLVYHFKY